MIRGLVLASVLISIVGVVYAVSGCCAPDTFQSNVAAFQQLDGVVAANEYIYFDWQAQRLRVDVFETYNKSAYVYTILERYDLGQAYIIEKDGKCYNQSLSGKLQRMCIPEGNVFKFVLGGSLQMSQYNYVNQGNWTQVSVTTSGCIPVVGAFLERHQSSDYGDLDWTYYNTELQITDHTVFNVPINCP